MDGVERDSGLRLSDLVAAFSLATDLGLGQPMEHVLRSWVIAARLGDELGLEHADPGALFYVATLAWVGCVADTPELAAVGVDAVLAAAGQSRGKRPSGPAGLTPREIEVLTLIARGASTRQVAGQLAITPKTAETHIERIYSKTGASTRSTATLFALQNGLLESLEPIDL